MRDSVLFFRLQLVDSVTTFTKESLTRKSPLMLVLFNPQCEHCQHEIGEIIKNIDKFKKIQIVLATTMPLDSLRKFYMKNELMKYENIIAGCDKSYFLVSFFLIHNFPYLAFYNKKKELISTFEGTMLISKILEIFD